MKEKQGVSLIVLVITIIVMVVLAGAIILTLNNSGIISKAEDAVKQTNLATIKEVAQMAWAEAYVDGAREQADLEQAVTDALVQNNITAKQYEGYTLVVTTSGVELVDSEEMVNKALNHSGIIPEGGTYYVGATKEELGVYTGATATYTAGQAFPGTVTASDIYVYGDYEYIYGETHNPNGWHAMAIDMEKTTYGVLLESINDEPLTSLNGLFGDCYSLEYLPDDFRIPETVTSIGEMFFDCMELKELPKGFTIPDGVTDMETTFFYCTSLANLPEGCVIPSNVDNLYCTFADSAISGTITINANPTQYDACFGNCDMSNITLTGSSTMLDELRATSIIE